MKKKLAVIGGGISGLTASYFALRKGYAVELYEASDRLGGLASSFDFDGLRIERFYHFLCGGDDRILLLSRRLGLGDKIRFRPTRTAIFLDGRYYPFTSAADLLRFSPLPIISRFRFGWNIVRSKYLSRWEMLDNVAAVDWLRRRIGKKAYRAVWEPLLKTKFGPYHERISAAWIWHRTHRVASSRRTLLSREKMGYFEGGTQTLIDEIEKQILGSGGMIRLGTAVGQLKRADDRYDLLTDAGRRGGFDRVVIAVPLPVAARLVGGESPAYARELSRIDFIGVVCGILRLPEKVSDAFWLNINDSRLSASGLIEYTNLNPLQSIAPQKIVYISLYTPTDDPDYASSEETLRVRFMKIIKSINPSLDEDKLLGFRVFREPHAQPICPVGFKNTMPAVATPLKNVFLLDSTQLYPSDRVLSGLIGGAEKMVDDYF